MPNTQPHRVMQVTASLSRLGGGVSTYIWGLTKHLQQLGLDITAATIDDPLLARERETFPAGVAVLSGPRTGPRSIAYSRAMHATLRQEIPTQNLVHLHGLRSMLNVLAYRACQTSGVPMIISPHGQLYPQVLEQRRMRKKIFASFFETPAFYRAARCMHVTSKQEAEHARRYGYTGPIAIVPVGIEPETFTMDSTQAEAHIEQAYPALRGKRRMLFFSLLHPKKGLDRLARMWGTLSSRYPDWSLVIAGPDDGYEAQARAAFNQQPVDPQSVVWTGGVYGHDKIALLTGADVMILPTDWENFGIVVPEALAAATPAIVTHGAPWSDLQTHNCGWWVPADDSALIDAAEHAMSSDRAELAAMGERGRALVYEKYTWSACARAMHELYTSVIEHSDWPAFVTLD